jgi:hypothetical protein
MYCLHVRMDLYEFILRLATRQFNESKNNCYLKRKNLIGPYSLHLLIVINA